MCRFKSGIILRGRVILAPKENESHQALLEKLGIDDNFENATKRFVRAELMPPDGNKAAPIDQWVYNVDQDIVPDWYKEDPKKYEDEMREAVAEYMKEELKNVAFGYDWTIVQDGEYTLHFMNGTMKVMSFGLNNNYSKSNVAEYLAKSKLLEDIKEKFGDKLVSFNLSLTSMDGFKDYGIMENCILAIPNIQVLMKYGENIPTIDRAWWLANPNQTPARNDSSCVQCVDCDGGVCYSGCSWERGVRPFFITKS